jgi:hypothetical protein
MRHVRTDWRIVTIQRWPTILNESRCANNYSVPVRFIRPRLCGPRQIEPYARITTSMSDHDA